MPTLEAWAKNKAIEVFADHVTFDLNQKTTVFEKNVRLSFDQYQAQCAKAIVYIDQKTQKVSKIVMQGAVTIKKGASVFKSNKMIFDVKQNKLWLKGQVYSRIQADRSWKLKLN